MSDHGYGRYSHGCRCEVCRAAKAAYLRRRRAVAAALARKHTNGGWRHLAQGVTHGTAFVYKDAGCRCGPCTEAASLKRKLEECRRRERQAS